MACRSKERGELALEKIKKDTGFDNIELWMLDLNSFASVKSFAERFGKEGGRLDILVENAGLWPSKVYDHKTDDGWTTILQSNVISPAYHALLLLPFMIRTATEHSTTPRIVVTGSFTHYFVEINKEYFTSSSNVLECHNTEKYYTQREIGDKYYDSKLLELLFFRALQFKVPSSGLSIIIDTIDPGYCATGFRSDVSGVAKKLEGIMERWIALTTEEGSRQIIYGAIAGAGSKEEEEKLKGSYISRSEVREASDFVLSEDGTEAQDKIWNDVVGALSTYDHAIPEILEQWK